ncbi:hypothetical protein BDW62DRAFT_199892 [Aspergillus aurantiobrunneus]
MAAIKSVYQRLYNRLFAVESPPPPEPPIFWLPECLLRDTFDLLDLVDQACLSVTCKLFQYLFSCLEARRVAFPAVPASHQARLAATQNGPSAVGA